MNDSLGWIITLLTGVLGGGCIGYWVGRIAEYRSSEQKVKLEERMVQSPNQKANEND